MVYIGPDRLRIERNDPQTHVAGDRPWFGLLQQIACGCNGMRQNATGCNSRNRVGQCVTRPPSNRRGPCRLVSVDLLQGRQRGVNERSVWWSGTAGDRRSGLAPTRTEAETRDDVNRAVLPFSLLVAPVRGHDPGFQNELISFACALSNGRCDFAER